MSKSVTSVIHYTSLDVLYAILQNALQDPENVSEKSPFITLHLGCLEMANDTVEFDFVLKKYFKELNPETQENNLIEELHYDGWQKFKAGFYSCAFSLMKSNKEDAQKGNLPLWSLYGNSFKGVYIRLDFQKLKKYCNANGLQFKEIGYHSQNSLDTFLRKNYTDINKNWPRLLDAAVFQKPMAWKHENEWRIFKMAKLEDMKVKTKNGIGYLYTEIKVPLEFINGIMLGPLVEFESQKFVIETLLKQINEIYKTEINIKITQSKIKVR